MTRIFLKFNWPAKPREGGRLTKVATPRTIPFASAIKNENKISICSDHTLPILFILALICCLQSLTQAQDLSISGIYVKRAHLFNGEIVTEPPVTYTIDLRDCEWKIRCKQDKGPSSPDYDESSFDGTNIYVLKNIKGAVEMQRKAGIKMGSDIATAKIYEGVVCNVIEAADISPIWLAYASGCYLKSQTSNFVEPLFYLDPESAMQFGPPKFNKMKARWTLTKGQYSFPSELAYLTSGKLLNARGNYTVPPGPYAKGFTNSYYRVLSYTNIGTTSIPLASKFRIYIPKTHGDTNVAELQTILEYDFTTTSAESLVRSDSFRTEIPGFTFVTDLRDTNDGINSLIYVTTNDWPSKQKLAEIKASRKDSQFTPVSVKIVRVLLIFLLVLPVVAFGLFLKRNSNKTNEITN